MIFRHEWLVYQADCHIWRQTLFVQAVHSSLVKNESHMPKQEQEFKLLKMTNIWLRYPGLDFVANTSNTYEAL